MLLDIDTSIMIAFLKMYGRRNIPSKYPPRCNEFVFHLLNNNEVCGVSLLLGLSVDDDLLLNLINDVLDISKIEAQKLSLEPSPVGLSSLLHSVVAMCEVKAKQKKIEFILAFDKIA